MGTTKYYEDDFAQVDEPSSVLRYFLPYKDSKHHQNVTTLMLKYYDLESTTLHFGDFQCNSF